MKTMFLLFLLSFPYTLFSQPIIDGSANEWTGTNTTVNTGFYSPSTLLGVQNLNEWIWHDADDDHRTDNFGGFVDNTKQDIKEIRISSDNNNLYYILKLEPNIDKTPGDGAIQLQISLRRNGSTSTTEYLGSLSDNLVPDATTPGGSIADARWDYLIVTRTGSSNNNHNIWNSVWTLNTSGVLSINSTAGIIEGSVPWADLGGVPNENTFLFTFSIYRANTSDNTFDTGGNGTKGNCLDFVTSTAGNTYAALIGLFSDSQGRLDYSVPIQFLANNNLLPVELTSFSAVVIGKDVKLSWNTATELNNYGFEIERSVISNGVRNLNWEKIGFVNGNGTSNSPKSYSFVDDKVNAGKYSYRLKQIDNDGQFEYSKTIEVDVNGVKEYKLTQNYPNPFNPATTIQYILPQAGNVKLTLYNILGQEIRTLVNEMKEAGTHTINIDASDLKSGMYIYKIESGSFVQTRKMTLVK